MSKEYKRHKLTGQTVPAVYSRYVRPTQSRITTHLHHPPISPKPSKINDFRADVAYYGYRWFDPLTGRWTSKDPIEEDGGLNLYGFVENKSVDLLDRLGLTIVSDDIDVEYRKKIIEALEKVTGADLDFEEYIGRSNCTGFEEKSGFQIKVIKPGNILPNWNHIKKAIEDKKLFVISQKLENGKSMLNENIDACCFDNFITITKGTNPQPSLESGKNSEGEYIWKKGDQGWEWVLYHELVTHAVLNKDHYHKDKNSASSNPNADPYEEDETKAPDSSIWYENQGRRAYNEVHPNNKVPLRRPTYFDLTELEMDKAAKEAAKEAEKAAKEAARKRR